MDYVSRISNPELEATIERMKNTTHYLDKEYTIDEFESDGMDEIVKKYVEAKEEAENLGGSVRIDLEYYPYIAGTKCLEITFVVEKGGGEDE